MSVKTLDAVGGVLETPIPVVSGQIVLKTTMAGRWLDFLYTILQGVGPQWRAEAVLNFANTAAQSSSELTMTVLGANLTDAKAVSVTSTVNPANSYWTAYVSAADTVTVRFNNYSAGAINPASGTFSVIVAT